MIRLAILAVLSAFALPAVCLGQSDERAIRPEIRKGDRWTYRSKNVVGPGSDTYDLRVENSDSQSIQVVAVRKSDGRELDATYTSEWNPVVTLSGFITRPPPAIFSFPMRTGDVRVFAYNTSRPRTSMKVPPVRVEGNARVAGWETVTVPAGNYRALKLTVDGKVTIDGNIYSPDAPRPGQFSGAYWYVPEVRRWVKVSFQYPNSEVEEELIEFKLNEN